MTTASASSSIDRRTFVKATAWSVPVIATAVALPLAAASVQNNAMFFFPSVPSADLANDFTGPLSYTANIFYDSTDAGDPTIGLFIWTLTLKNIYDESAPSIPIANGSQEINKGETWTTSDVFDTTAVPRGYYRVTLDVTSARTIPTWRGIRVLAPIAGLRAPADDITFDFTAEMHDDIFSDIDVLNYAVTVGYTGADADRAYTVPWTLTLQKQGETDVLQFATSDALTAVDGPYYHDNTYRPPTALTAGTYTVEGTAQGTDRPILVRKTIVIA
ncbi:hypothetical protein [Microbacterium murale]|uniref:Uncharacterized protein n=1 Tax=Microbacterium murale TaxID=1081040 RepID=A0ABU0PA73_9MICO|nr:hypothetical protein [Microbacterium murale]MDQ0643524.1 hypothetical protein [Microbacterium murale]